jgi:hypothetical protein
VVGVFILIKKGTGGGGCKPVSEASLICGEATTLSKSAENLALQVSRISPDLICLDIYLQMLKIIGIETLVREHGIREVAHSLIRFIGMQNHRAKFVE